MNDNVSQKVVEIVNQIQSITPSFAKAALISARLSCIQNLVIGLILLIIGVLLIYVMIKLKQEQEIDEPEIVFGIIVGFVISIVSLFILFDLNMMVGILHPDVYLAKQFIDKVVK